MEKVIVPAKAGRLVDAVASIGYDPEVALCDLIDNCIDAGATSINVALVEAVREQEGQTDTVGRYIVADDGCGMNKDALINAFTLGSFREYPGGSLGKFGLGLKSAGLSLGDVISVVSKEADGQLFCSVLSVADVHESGEYRVRLGAPPAELNELWETHAPKKEKGTLLVIDEPSESQPSFSTFVRYFRRYCSNIYHLFLDKEKYNLRININDEEIQPIDPIFFNEAQANGPLSHPADWDGKTPCLLLADQPLHLDSETDCFIAATHLIHPPSFEEEGRNLEMRDRFQIELDPYTRRPRHGFYVYRNRRIIVMAERFHGLISTANQAWAFRGRLMFDEQADEVLALDVKKRHMRLPKAARNNLKNMIANYQSKSIEAWKSAGRRHMAWRKEKKDKIANESIIESPVSDLTYAPGADIQSDEDMKSRVELQSKVGQETLAAVQDASVSKMSLEARAQENDSVVPVEALKANAMWLPYPAVELGRAETVVNKSHSWIAEVLASAEEDPKIALVFYQFVTILARAELEMRSTPWQDVQTGVAERVLDRFRRKASAIGEDLAETLAVQMKNLDGLPIDED